MVKTRIKWITVNRISAFGFLVMLVVLMRSTIGFNLLGPVLLVLYVMAVVSGMVALHKEKEKKKHSFISLQLVLITLMAIAIFLAPPGPIIETKQEALESGAIATLRTIASAQKKYADRWHCYGTAVQLEAVNMIDSVTASATTTTSAKSGYYFKIVVGDNVWCCGARAAEWGETGERSFRISQDGIIYYSDKDEDMTITTSGTPLGG